MQSKIVSLVAGSHYIRSLVSKKRRRLVVGGYDLDLSYITDRLVAMSFPAENMRAMFRNPIWQVRRALDARHGSHYKVYNLCAEACYDPMQFYGRVEFMPFDDMHPPPLALVKLFCESVQEWLARDPENVAVVHCMAGKGRTGCMVCSYLVYIGMNVGEALQLYADRRTYNNEGVTISSQRQYVSYWSKVLTFRSGNRTELPEVHLPPPKSRELRRIRLYDTMYVDRVQFTVSELREIPGQLYQPAVEVAKGVCRTVKKGYHRTVSPRYFVSFLNKESNDDERSLDEPPHFVVQMDTEKPVIYSKSYLDHYFDMPLPVTGDVRLTFNDMKGRCLFYACFNTAFIVNSMLQLCQRDLDKMVRKAKSIFGPSFCVELVFGPTKPHYPSYGGNIENYENSF